MRTTTIAPSEVGLLEVNDPANLAEAFNLIKEAEIIQIILAAGKSGTVRIGPSL